MLTLWGLVIVVVLVLVAAGRPGWPETPRHPRCPVGTAGRRVTRTISQSCPTRSRRRISR